MSVSNEGDIQENLKKLLASSPPRHGATSVEAILLADTRCQLAEGILYDNLTDCIVWTDIYWKKFYKLSLSGDNQGILSTTDLPRMLCSFAFLKDSDAAYLCAWQDGFQLFDLENNKALSEYSAGEDVTPLKLPTRLNDGRCDREGRRFICGGYYGVKDGVKMKVYKVEYNKHDQLSHTPIVDEIQVANSICFSPINTTMYLADSPSRKIHSYDYDAENGTISNKTLVYTESLGVPDGSTCDSQGFLWNAVWRDGAGASMVNRINPKSGEVVFTVKMPDATSQVSCCCLGGKDLDILFITTAAVDRDSKMEPHAGAIYAAKVGVKGQEEGRFVGR